MNFVLRMLSALIFSGILAFTAFSKYDHEIGTEAFPEGTQRYSPYLPSMLLPIMIVMMFCIGVPKAGFSHTLDFVASFCFGIFLTLSVYYLILSLLLPLLRRRYSARGCAMLWIVPNYLYIMAQDFMSLPEPLIVIRPGNVIFRYLVLIWFAGFLAVLGWKIIEHLRFRHRILCDAAPITDPQVLEVWNQEILQSGIHKPKFRLVSSAQVQTPLTIGCFRRTTCVVLPEHVYCQDELALILRHELIHICREDCTNKFFLVFCTAVCWFNPLTWIAMRRSAEDLELSCDESVLLDADDDTRRQYADLILSTAGDERGFTTCLSASASALRYRLKQIVKPRKTRTGALIVGIAFFLLCMSCGYVAISFEETTGKDAIFHGSEYYLDDSDYRITSIRYSDEQNAYFTHCTSEASLKEYLAALPLSRLSGNYSFDGERMLVVILQGPNGGYGVTLRDRTVTVLPLSGERSSQQEFYLSTGTDWELILSLMKAAES